MSVSVDSSGLPASSAPRLEYKKETQVTYNHVILWVPESLDNLILSILHGLVVFV